MSVEDFYMEIGRTMFRETHIQITAAEGSMKSELEVSLPDFEFGLSNISDYLFDWIMQQLEPRVTNAYGDGLITVEELEAYRKIIKVIEW